MGAERFDLVVRSLGRLGTRRGLLHLLGIVSFSSGVATALDADTAAADGRRPRRGTRPTHGKPRRHGKRKNTKKECRPQSRATTCAGKCGEVRNNCQKTVDCGSCACNSPCGACEICHADPGEPGACITDPERLGEPCGDPGQRCQADGFCACDAGSCQNPTPICVSGDCQVCTSHAECVAAGRGDRCCDGECFAGNCCVTTDCSGQTPICVGHACTACSASHPCPNGGCCTSEQRCIANGAACTVGSLCSLDDTCQNGTCRGTPVTCDSPTECQNAGSCDPDTGLCAYPPKADGTRCGNKCAQSCTNGSCGAGTPVTCSAPTNKAQGTVCQGVPCGVCNGSGTCVSRCAAGACCDVTEACIPQGQDCSNGAACCNGECACFTGLCRVSPMGANCCCTNADQICTDARPGGNCEFPP